MLPSRLAFLGTGLMGGPMARNLLRAGFPLTVWNRSRAEAEPLVSEGARVPVSAADAVRDADLFRGLLAHAGDLDHSGLLVELERRNGVTREGAGA